MRTTARGGGGPGSRATGTRRYTDRSVASRASRAGLWAAVSRDGSVAQRVVHLWSLDRAGQRTSRTSTRSIARVGAVRIERRAHGAGARGSVGVSIASLLGRHAGGRAAGAVARWRRRRCGGSAARSALEHPELWGGLIDVPHEIRKPQHACSLASSLSAGGEDQVALTRHQAPGRRVSCAGRTPAVRAVAHGCPVRRDVPRHRRRSALLDCTPLGGSSRAARAISCSRVGARRSMIPARAAIEALEREGATVAVVAGRRLEAARRGCAAGRGSPLVRRRCAESFTPPAWTRTIPVAAMTAQDLETALAAKVRGGWLLHERTRASGLDLFVCFSSLASVLGAQGRAHYAAANAFLDALAAERRRLGLAGHDHQLGTVARRRHGCARAARRSSSASATAACDPHAAVEMLDAVVGAGSHQTVVADIDWTIFRRCTKRDGTRPMLARSPHVVASRRRRSIPARPRAQRIRQRWPRFAERYGFAGR